MTSGKADRRPDKRSGEFELIAELFAPLSKGAPGAFGLTDDAAVLAPPPGHELVLKTDAIVESVHFFRTDPPGVIAQKALRVNLSDLAAKGAAPMGYLLALLLPDWPDMAWLRRVCRPVSRQTRRAFGLSLMGGDTSATPGPLAVSISAFGFVPAGAMIRRAGAKPGDARLRLRHDRRCRRRSRRPQKRTSLRDPNSSRAIAAGAAAVAGPALRGFASASLDVSDGLMADLGHIADVSKVRIEVGCGADSAVERIAGIVGRTRRRRRAPRSRATTTRSLSPRRLAARRRHERRGAVRRRSHRDRSRRSGRGRDSA